jgi:hypothetical protein
MKINYSRGQIGSMLTWIVAFIVIFFILAVFFGATAFLSKTKGTFEINQGEKVQGNLESQLRLERVLNSYVEIDGRVLRIKDSLNNLNEVTLGDIKRLIDDGCNEYLLLLKESYIYKDEAGEGFEIGEVSFARKQLFFKSGDYATLTILGEGDNGDEDFKVEFWEVQKAC